MVHEHNSLWKLYAPTCQSFAGQFFCRVQENRKFRKIPDRSYILALNGTANHFKIGWIYPVTTSKSLFFFANCLNVSVCELCDPAHHAYLNMTQNHK